jgi:hypothetical protein
MTRITLHAMVPVYVQVDTDTSEVTNVVANAEELAYVKAATYTGDNPGQGLTGLETCDQHELPLAYNEQGVALNASQAVVRAAIEKAREIAESGPSLWPSWSFSW